MNPYKILTLFFFSILFFNVKAQRLLRQVPEDAQAVFTFNGKAFFNHLKPDDLDLALTRWGFFEKVYGGKFQTAKLEDMGIDLNSKAYAYVRTTDSIQFVGAFIPLSDRSKFEALIPDHKKIEMANGLSTIYSADRSLWLSWDQQTLYVLNGNGMDYYFNSEESKKRYGLLTPAYNDYDYLAQGPKPVLDDTISPPIADIDTTMWNYHQFDTLEELHPPALDSVDGDYILDSVAAIEQRDYQYSSTYDSVYHYNDSIKRVLVGQWVNTEMGLILGNKLGSYDERNIPKLSNNDLVHLHVKQVSALYSNLYPEVMLRDFFGIRPKFDYGIEGVNLRLTVDGRSLKLAGEASLDKEMASYYRAIYPKKLNSKFYPFLDKDALGFMALQMSTEAYLKYFPKIIEKYYGAFLPRYSNALSFGTTLFDVLLDEKAIGRVFTGDNLFILKGVTKQTVPYTDYVYDDDYNYREVQKTRTESIPQFLWIFSSDDTRIFEKLIQLGIQENELQDRGGIYALKEKRNSGIQLLFLIKNGMVFIGNDFAELQSIQSGKSIAKGYAPYIAMAKKNVFSMLFNTKRLPALLSELDIPVEGALKGTMDEMAQYGDFYITSQGVRGRKLQGEAVVEFPDKKGNALAFLFDTVDQWFLRSIK